MEHRILRRGTALSLALCVAASCAGTALAAPDDGVRPVYDEAYYVTTDWYGGLTNGSVVKSYVLNGAEEITDYGSYDAVTDLSGVTDPSRTGEQVTFRFGQDAPSHFYFEGKTDAPFRRLPWTISVHYSLNGVPTRAEDLAGKTGVVQIDIDAVPNPAASDHARHNYVLAVTAVFDQDDILSLEAPGAQVQLIGNLRAVLFLAFPGEDQQFMIRVGAEEFSFGGLTFLLTPATLSQLDEISKIAEKKEDLEDSYHQLSDSLDAMLDAFGGMQEHLYETADGLDALDEARRTISQGKDAAYDELDQLRQGLAGMASALDPVAGLAQDTSRHLTASVDAADALVDAALGLRPDLVGLEDRTASMEARLISLEEGVEILEGHLEGLEGDLETLEGPMADLSEEMDPMDRDLEELAEDLEDIERSARDLEDRLSALEDALGDVEGGLEDLEDGGDDVSDLLEDAAGMRSSLDRLRRAIGNVRAPSYSSGTSYRDQLDLVAQVGDLYSLTATEGAQEEAFFTAMLVQQGYDPETAAQIAALLATNDTDLIAANDPDGSLTAAYQQLYTLYNIPDFTTFCTVILQQQGYSESEAASTAAQMDSLWKIYKNSDRDKAALELLLGSADDLESDLGSASRSASSALDAVRKPSMDVLGNLADLCGQLDDLQDLVEDAQDLSADLRGASSRLRETSRSLRGLSGTARDASAHLRDDTGTLRDVLQIASDGLADLRESSVHVREASAVVREVSSAARDTSSTARDLLEILRSASGKSRKVLDAVADLRTVLDRSEPTFQSSLAALGDLSASAAAAVRDADDLAGTIEALSRPAGRQLDTGSELALDGLAATLRKAAEGLDTTTDVQDAKDAITDLIEDTWDDYTGDVNDLLEMDPGADAQSLTDPRNPSPQSVQILIRTQEIELPDEDEETTGSASGSASQGKPTTFLGRIGQMFRDLWDAVSGIFR